MSKEEIIRQFTLFHMEGSYAALQSHCADTRKERLAYVRQRAIEEFSEALQATIPENEREHARTLVMEAFRSIMFERYTPKEVPQEHAEECFIRTLNTCSLALRHIV